MKQNKFYLVVLFIIMLQGCNSIYFYETDKYSLTVEGRPDVTSPVSFNFGVKQRIAAVVPEKGIKNCEDASINGANNEKNDDNCKVDNNGEAVALMSYFNLDKENEDGWLNDPITVETAFITGKVAASLGASEKNTAGEVLNAISGSSSLSGNDFVYIRNLISVLTKDAKQGSQGAKDILAKLNNVNQQLTTDMYPVTTYIFKGPQKKLSEKHMFDSKIEFKKNINGLLDYLGELYQSDTNIQAVLKKPDEYTVQGIPANNPIVTSGLKATLNQTEQVSKKIGGKLKNDPAYIAAVKYYIDNH